MTLPKFDQSAILSIIKTGATRSIEKLAQISRTSWDITTVDFDIGVDLTDQLQTLLAADSEAYYGAYFSMPGIGLMVMFPRENSGDLVRGYSSLRNLFQSSNEAVPDLQQNTLAELSNILANAVVSLFGDAINKAIVLSAPETVVGTRGDLFWEVLNKFKSKESPGPQQPKRSSYMGTSYVHMSSAMAGTDCTMIILLAPAVLNRFK